MMKISRLSARTAMIAAVLAATAMGSTAALARGGDCDWRGERGAKNEQMTPEARQERMQQRVDAKLSKLETALALTPEQKPAWDRFKTSAHERVAAMQPMRPADASAMSAVERMKRMEEHLAKRSTELGKARAEVETFYATLSDTQKAAFDKEFRFGMDDRRGGGRRR